MTRPSARHPRNYIANAPSGRRCFRPYFRDGKRPFASGLLRKRSEIAGEIAFHQERWRQLSQDLVSVDATIQIVAPDYEIGEGHPPTYIPPPHQAYKGEVARLVAQAFRLNPDRGLSTSEIAEHGS